MEYRIVTDEKLFKVQERVLWIFWVNYKEDARSYSPMKFNNIIEAENLIKRLQKREKWRVVKYY